MIGVRIVIRRPDDHWPERPLIEAPGREHRGCQRSSFAIPQGEEGRHTSLDMRLQTDVSLDERSGWRNVCPGGMRLGLHEVLLNSMAHGLGLKGGLRMGLDAKPSLPSGRIAHVAPSPD